MIRLEMLQVARLGPKLLGESTELVHQFFRRRQNEDGGFQGRTPPSDLYYTVFALEGLIALAPELSLGKTSSFEAVGPGVFERARSYLRGFKDGAELDLVHLCCLARCWASVENVLAQSAPAEYASEILQRLENFRSKDGGYNPAPNAETGTAYACFLVLAAYQDLRAQPANVDGLVDSLQRLRTQDGAWTNERPRAGKPELMARVGSTNATAAAVTVLRNLHRPVDPAVGDWLLARAHPQGGFVAVPNAPVPDLLSTATALHALAGLQVSFGQLKDACLDFIDSLWTNEGGFYGHWHDEHLDCEYTYYALLALGHLSLA